MRKELDAIDDDDEREQRVAAHRRSRTSAARRSTWRTLLELDDVIDPADTRRIIARTLAAAGTPAPSRRTVDSW